MAQVTVHITLKPTLLDAQGRVVQNALNSLGYAEVGQVRIGKLIAMEVGGDPATVGDRVQEMCDRLLANPVIEDYSIIVDESAEVAL
ncbi:MAG TPA: phosphoribosylformylglycinamidine synthase subunit PurS [Chthonomonadales bacterium]|nr:phosphoribosylformylglycinamidine synthase subunit PurS [Chthonomonadales bacterium]